MFLLLQTGEGEAKNISCFSCYKQVKDITRTFKLVDGELTYEVEMATGSVSLQPHLKASLKKL